MPPAWDPPKLLLVVGGGLHVVVDTSAIVGVVAVVSGSWAPASGCDNQKERKGGEGGRKQP